MGKKKSILVTGCNGMLGQRLVIDLLDAGYNVTGVSTSKNSACYHERFSYISADLTRISEVERIFNENKFSHVIHLAAIAHVFKGLNISWSKYYRVNTLMSRSIFEYASSASIPVFFSSTVDIYGTTKQIINEESNPHPVGSYAKSKLLAEKSLLEVASQPFLIARFAPIYREDNQRDIRRRYYIKYPKLCYLIGDGMEYEFLSVQNAIKMIVEWVKAPDTIQGILNVCDIERHNTKTLIDLDKKNGAAKKVIWIPEWMRKIMHVSVNILFYKKPFLKFTAYKIISPMRFERRKLVTKKLVKAEQ
ncbi:NAD(P)-dependent oxidoreductase [Virgibacillus sp. NKC19-16]|uniref:NAD-dependent epimerase/dehydratase family protein n=1 Tax=Virgibacillus salidurans TaxID=2831673 RepID=UPI001F45E96B|nr:NAD(P)-dependent oxidoreductase [Virgibacillus sp. NKC19-16]UJL45817.1 NAD(P)-dependent oxidoreductase [Virgibacillus sp. NKC19-16]